MEPSTQVTAAEPAVTRVKAGRRKMRTADFSIFEDTARKLGLSHGDLAEQLGFAKNSAYNWSVQGRFPYSGALACEALLKRRLHSAAREDNSLTFLVRIENGRIVETRPVSGEKTATLDKQTYLLVPTRSTP